MVEIEPYYTGLGERLREAREALGLTQADVGGLMRPPMTRASVANIEAAKQRVLAHQVPMLARIVEIPPAQLLGERQDLDPLEHVGNLARLAVAQIDRQRRKDLEGYAELDRIASEVRYYLTKGNMRRVKALVKLGCDTEYRLTLDCKAFGDLSEALKGRRRRG